MKIWACDQLLDFGAYIYGRNALTKQKKTRNATSRLTYIIFRYSIISNLENVGTGVYQHFQIWNLIVGITK